MVSKALQNGVNFFVKKQNSILSAAVVISLMMLLSRILGLVKSRLLAGAFGGGAELDIYFAAFRIPDFLFQLLVMGALSSSFIPVFSEYLQKKETPAAWDLARDVINSASLIFLFITVFIFLFTKNLCQIIAPDFAPWQLTKMVELVRVMMLGQFFLIISNFVTGILQSFKRFLISSLAPVFYNLGIIGATAIWSSKIGIMAPAIGVSIGCLLHLLIQIPLLFKLGFPKISFRINFRNKGLHEVTKLMIPRTLGLAVSQIDPTVDLILASAITGGVSVFNLALNIQSVPVGLFGFAIGTAALPTLSEQLGAENLEKFKKIFLNSLHQILFLTIPSSVFIIILRVPIVRLFLGTGKFDWQDTLTTALTLGFFALSIAAQSLVHLLARAFYALHNTKTPVYTGLISVATNVIFAIIFVKTSLGIAGLALATSLANFINAGLLMFFLDRKVARFDRQKVLIPFFKLLFTSFVMALSIYFPVKILDSVFLDTSYTINLLILVILVSTFGGVVFFLLSYILDIPELKILINFLKKAKNIPKAFLQTEVEEIVSED